ncbi:cupin domain-containing protein (plasmid) [Rhodococcus opacus]|uniref:cupin domain-containing protein n=1 Tax=Rhodococcus opacus TaxID=37919 RepID=UPI0034D3417C
MAQISQWNPENTVPTTDEVDKDTVLEGDPKQESVIQWRSPDNTVVAGIFRSTVGKFTFSQVGDESTIVRKGRVIVTAEDGSSVDCRPGDVMNISRDATCVFDVLEDLEDYFVISNPDGVAL